MTTQQKKPSARLDSRATAKTKGLTSLYARTIEPTIETRRDLLQAALTFAARGWPVLPCENKRPLLKRWPTAASTDPATIARWLEQYPTAGIGIVTGARSGLAVIDVDPRAGGNAGLAVLCERHGPLPATLTVATGGGGAHHYFKHPGGTIPNRVALDGMGGVDVRGDGGFVVGPPSLHESGTRYAWVDERVPVATLPDGWARLLRADDAGQGVSGAASSDTVHTGTQSHRESLVCTVSDRASAIEAAIRECLPSRAGTRRRAIFRLAQRLKAIDAEMSESEQRGIFERWHARALGIIRTKAFIVSWMEFLSAWASCKYAPGEWIARIVAASQSLAVPARLAERYADPDPTDPTGGPVLRLLRLCYALQKHHGDGAFFVSCRMAAAAIGMGYDSAAAMLRALVRDGILIVTKPYDRARPRAATEYKWADEWTIG